MSGERAGTGSDSRPGSSSEPEFVDSDTLLHSESAPAVEATGGVGFLRRAKPPSPSGSGSGSSPLARGDAPELPETIGRYRVTAELGHGAMGIVYAGIDDRLDRKVAIKTLWAADNAQLHERLVREARALAKLTHPNVVRIYEISDAAESSTGRAPPYIVMELVEGQTLRQWLELEPEGGDGRDLDELLAVFCAAGRGLAAIHAAGLVHRDIKPDNVMIDGSGRVLVMDLGVAHSRTGAALSEGLSTGSLVLPTGSLDITTGGNLTRTGTLVGSPAYMSPEQFGSGTLSDRSDQFSLCITLWEALYGARPFDARTLPELMEAVTEGERPTPPPRAHARLGHAAVPRGVARALTRGLAANPDARFPSMIELVEALEGARTRRSPGRGWAWAGLASAAALAALALLVRSPELGRDPAAPAPTPALSEGAALPQPEPSTPVELQVDHGPEREFAYLPGAHALVYAGEGGLWLRDLDSHEEILLDEDYLEGLYATPDGSVYYVSARLEEDTYSALVRIHAPEFGELPEFVAGRVPLFCVMPERGLLVHTRWTDKALTVEDLDAPSPTVVDTVPLYFEGREDFDWLGFVACDDRTGTVIATILDDSQTQLQRVDLDTHEAVPVYRLVGAHSPYIELGPGGRELYVLNTREGLGPQLESVALDDDGANRIRVVVPGRQLYAMRFDVSTENDLTYHTRASHGGQLLRIREPRGREEPESRGEARGPIPPLDLDAAELLFDTEDVIFSTAFAPRGQAMAVVTEGGGGRLLRVVPLIEGGPEGEYPLRDAGKVTFAPDARSLAFVGRIGEEPRLWTLELTSTARPQVHELTSLESGSPSGLEWTSTGELIYQTSDHRNFWRYDPRRPDQEPRLLAPGASSKGWMFYAEATPDGRHLAVSWNQLERGLWLFDLETGAARRIDERYPSHPMGWSSDGTRLYLRVEDELWRIPAPGAPAGSQERPRALGKLSPPPGHESLDCQPGADGELLCFASREETRMWFVPGGAG
ncbi:serine/threonine kinase PKN8 [Plesiocystis pacifica SIR-1]|uniref:Serine/threonine kinase PKN8 n=1 Tax=Plesiocystis pacifica SIR-1 TaxID=391625 RepID=A6GIK4_9BACT|nr:serine/threonine-protein kinase [Plesiocystis pacifica]EDM74290.1 serine/threonine kinase PKN8 [Plesiocystis pacifica SIR-1]